MRTSFDGNRRRQLGLEIKPRSSGATPVTKVRTATDLDIEFVAVVGLPVRRFAAKGTGLQNHMSGSCAMRGFGFVVVRCHVENVLVGDIQGLIVFRHKNALAAALVLMMWL
jgi:hypothetical protein